MGSRNFVFFVLVVDGFSCFFFDDLYIFWFIWNWYYVGLKIIRGFVLILINVKIKVKFYFLVFVVIGKNSLFIRRK